MILQESLWLFAAKETLLLSMLKTGLLLKIFVETLIENKSIDLKYNL